MPSYLQLVDTTERWRELAGLERFAPTPRRPRAVLTFDDGPDPDATPAVLAALDRAGIRATFFVVGEQLLRHRTLADEALGRGHELALHGFRHVEHDELAPGAARDDLARAVGAFEATTGRRPRWYRPPYGRFSPASYAACRDLRMEPVYWSAWGLDWEPIGPARIADLACRDLGDGIVVLLHDSARYAPRGTAMPTAEAIAAIAEHAAAVGIELRTLGEAA